MFDHVVLSVRSIERSIAFYEAVLRPLGITKRITYPGHPDHAPLEGFGPARQRHAPGDEPRQPVAVRPCQRIGRRCVMAMIGVDRTEDGLIVEHHRPIEHADIECDLVARRYAGETDDAGRRGASHRLLHHGRGAGAFHHNVGL